MFHVHLIFSLLIKEVEKAKYHDDQILITFVTKFEEIQARRDIFPFRESCRDKTDAHHR